MTEVISESWKRFIKESEEIPPESFYWMSGGPVKKGFIKLGQTTVPRARPITRLQGLEELFEKVRKEVNPSAPSRLNCVYICENVEGYEGNSFCSTSYLPEGSEIYLVQLKSNANVLKTDSEYWTEATFATSDEEKIRWAKQYWMPSKDLQMSELLVSPPESAVFVKRVK